MRSSAGLRAIVVTIFVASGCAGLVYQSIWSHYLGLLLGHAAYAQTLVLAIFMGGMAIGAWIAASRSGRWKKLFAAYAVIEILIGLLGLAFHPIFLAYSDAMFDTILPALGSSPATKLVQWVGAGLLITPQTILLGATFPVMSAAWLRQDDTRDSKVLGELYFANSIGAAIGALAGTFLLMPVVGLPGTVMTAGVLNTLVGLVAWVALRQDRPPREERGGAREPAAVEAVAGDVTRWLLVAAAITGATSFVYEIGWVRMLNQVLGTTVHSFEIMLAAFIAGIAFGGRWIARRREGILQPIRWAAYAQVAMGVMALLSLVAFAHSFDAVAAMLKVLSRTPGAYTLYTLGSALIAIVVMMPAAFFAGMTLPLFTVALLRAGSGESAVGRVYATNTVGAIAGVFLAVHVLVPVMGVRLAVALAAVADIVLGVLLLRVLLVNAPTRAYYAALGASFAAALLSLGFGNPDPSKLASGVFRTGLASSAGRVDYLRDGKTATISVKRDDLYGAIGTNGKTDATLALDPALAPATDEITMIMAGALPLMRHPDPKRIAVIGWGSGLTTHTLAGSPAPDLIENIEIERAMYDGARLFGARVARAYEDPRSTLHVDDARTFFAARADRYDVIVSEPSNPWVSGVASLFTREWYLLLSRYLDEGGVLVQWTQTYEMSDRLLATMVAALIDVYPYVEVYHTDATNLLFLASRSPIAPLRFEAVAHAPLRDELARVALTGPTDFERRKLGDREVLAAYVRMYGATPHSDYFPTVSLEGPRERFLGSFALAIPELLTRGLPVLEMTGKRVPDAAASASGTDLGLFAKRYQEARILRAAMLGAPLDADHLVAVEQRAGALHGLLELERVAPADVVEWSVWAHAIATTSIGFLGAEESVGVWIDPVWIDVAQQPEPVRLAIDTYAAVARRDAAGMARAAEAALALRPDTYHPWARSYFALIGMLGYVAGGDHAAARDAASRWHDALAGDANNERLARFLAAWAAAPRRPER